MRAEVRAPEDVLELFARLNRSGMPFRDSDIYFAAVKTFWTDAEPSLKRVLQATTYVAANGTQSLAADHGGGLAPGLPTGCTGRRTRRCDPAARREHLRERA